MWPSLRHSCRSEHPTRKFATLGPLLHAETSACVRAERAFNSYLEGGCQVPIAGYATLSDEQIHIEGRVGSVDGASLLIAELSGSVADAEQLGETLAKRLLDLGAGELLRALH